MLKSACLAVLVMLMAGCGRDEPTVYRVAKDTAFGAPPAPLSWSTPPTWTEQPAREMVVAVYAVPGDAEMTVSHIGGMAGGALANVNRWRGQLQLPPIDEAALETTVVSAETAAGTAQKVRLANDDTATIVVWLIHGGETWFFKLSGPLASVDAEAANFDRVVASLQSGSREAGP